MIAFRKTYKQAPTTTIETTQVPGAFLVGQYLLLGDGASNESGREGPLLRKLPASAREGLETIGSSATYPKAAILFVEGQARNGWIPALAASPKQACLLVTPSPPRSDGAPERTASEGLALCARGGDPPTTVRRHERRLSHPQAQC